MKVLGILLTILNFLGCSTEKGEKNSTVVGEYCVLKLSTGSGLSGVCRFMRDCGGAISNYRAGIRPQLCENKNLQEKSPPIVCCPSGRRISEKKCEEYSQLRFESTGLTPFLPPEFLMQSYNSGNGANVQRKCTNEAQGYIANGRNAQEFEFPYMVALGYQELEKQMWLCGGTLISADFVLTAAHCVQSSKAGEPKRVLLGDVYLQRPGKSRRKRLAAVSEIILHPEYIQPLKYHDIALLRLRSPVKFKRSIRPACLPSAVDRLELEKSGTIVGWGQLEFGGGTSNLLQAAAVLRTNQSTCGNYYNGLSQRSIGYPQGILKSQFCAGDHNKDTCRGDSGGPMIVKVDRPYCKEFVTGVTSFGTTYCGHGIPGVYTNVQSYLDWIERIVWGSN